MAVPVRGTQTYPCVVSTATGNIASATPAVMIPAATTSFAEGRGYNDILVFIATNATSTATSVIITDKGTSGNSYTFDLAANGGIVINFQPACLIQGVAGYAWEIESSAAVSVDFTVVYAVN